MEDAIYENDYILLFCSELYKKKFDSREGGVGYEANLITSILLDNRSNKRFIPIIDGGDFSKQIPRVFSAKYAVDISKGENFLDLLATLGNVKKIAPRLESILMRK